MKRKLFVLIIPFLSAAASMAQVKTYLHKNKDTTQGYLLSYKCTQPASTAVLICPGGGYFLVAMDHEGTQVAEWLNRNGIDAYVLRYSVSTKDKKYYYPSQLNEVRAAMKLISQNGYRHTGILGFSAGGHLAGSYLVSKKQKADFGILLYPVITTDTSCWHRGSFENLLGQDYRDKLNDSYSVEKNVTAKTPPLWLMHCKDDEGVPAKNSELLFAASQRFQSKSELHLFEKGGHGFGMNPVNEQADSWKALCIKWIDTYFSK